MRFSLLATLLGLLIGVGSVGGGDPPKPKVGPVATLFEDDAEALLNLLTNPGDGAGKGEAEGVVVFSGKKSLKITHYQRFHRTLPGWDFPIREKPKAHEYRYLRFAWKAGGSNCLMLQLHDTLDWHIRYTAGANPYGWATRFVSDKAPGDWQLVTIDLFKDFGERNLTGIAFTINGGAGYFDHVYLGRTVEDLDRIDASGLAGKRLDLKAEELNRLWDELVAADAAVAYRAFWRLVAGREASVAYLKRKLALDPVPGAEGQEVREWIRMLDAESSRVREKATAELKKKLDVAAPMLEAELARSPSAEVRWRIEKLLAGRGGEDRDRQRREKARRVLQFVAEADAK